MRSRALLARMLAACLLLVPLVLLGACGSSSQEPSSGEDAESTHSESPEELLERSAGAVEAAGTARFSLDFDMIMIDVRWPMHGEGSFSGEDYGVVVSTPEGEQLYEMRAVDGSTYMYGDGGEPEGAAWHDTTVDSAGFDGPFKPQNYLDMLYRAEVVADHGLEECDGTECRHLELSLDMLVYSSLQYGNGMSDELAAENNPVGTAVTIDVWVEPDSALPHEMLIDLGGDAGSGSLNFDNYGEPITIDAPL